MKYLSVRDLPLHKKRVLVRVDFSVPLSSSGEITDNTRIKETIPTLNYILDQGGIPLLLSHFGRPEGKRDPKLSLKPCADELAKLMNRRVHFVEELFAPLPPMKEGELLLFENVRFYPGEEEEELGPTFAPNLARLGDLYVNDAFAAAHRKNAATITRLPKLFPGKAAAGLLMEREVKMLSYLLDPKPPFFAILGGAKISTKLGVLHALMKKVDLLFVGGGLAYTLLAAQGMPIGESLVESDLIREAKKLLTPKLRLPLDLIVCDKKKENLHPVDITKGIPPGYQGMSIGPKTCDAWKKELTSARTLFWNGPLGVYEDPRFQEGTLQIAQSMKDLDAVKIVGGGDSLAAIHALHLEKNFTHLSTGGGASLEFIERGTLPGLEALSPKKTS